MRFGFLVLLLAAVAPAIPAQNAAQDSSSGPQVTIRTESRLVLVDAIVTDKKGKPVRELSAKDFRVWEDNREQAISSFGLETATLSPERSQKRYLVFFFDNSAVPPSAEVSNRREVVKFIEAYASPDRYMAVVNFSRGNLTVAQDFTAMADKLKRAAGAIQGTGVAATTSSSMGSSSTGSSTMGSSSSAGAAAGRGGFGQGSMASNADTYTSRALLSSLRALVGSLSAVRGRKALIFFSGGFSLLPELTQDLQATIKACNQANVAVYAVDARGLGFDLTSSINEAPAPSSSLLARLSGAIGGLVSGFVPSDSRIGFASALFQTSGQGGGGGQTGGGQSGGGQTGGGSTPGGTTSPGGGGTTPGAGTGGTGTTGGLSGTTGRSGSTTMSPGGIADPGYTSGVPERQYNSQEPLAAIASGTGGLFFRNAGQIVEVLGKVAQEQDEYYLLGYVPPQVPEGSCHALRVKVNRGGLTVRARNSYCSDKPVGLLAGTPAARELEARAAGSSAGNVRASIQLPYFYSAQNVARVQLAMEILPTGMKFQKQGGKFLSEMNVLGIAYNSGGSVAARFSDTVKLDFPNQKEADAFLSQPFHYENQFEIAPGDYKVTVALSAGSESFGKLETPLVIERYASTALAVSGLALGKEVRRAADLTSGLDESLLTGPKALVSGGVQLAPYGANRFQRTERCLVYFEIYEPLLTTASPPTVGVRLRIIDRKTGAPTADSGTINVSDRVRAGNPVVPMILAAPVANLAPGSYQVEVRALDSAGGISSLRTADFELN